MKHFKLILGLVAVMMAMIAVSAVPAMAKDNDRHENRVDNRLDRLNHRLDRFGEAERIPKIGARRAVKPAAPTNLGGGAVSV